jgi:hypothetical protein
MRWYRVEGCSAAKKNPAPWGLKARGPHRTGAFAIDGSGGELDEFEVAATERKKAARKAAF